MTRIEKYITKRDVYMSIYVYRLWVGGDLLVATISALHHDQIFKFTHAILHLWKINLTEVEKKKKLSSEILNALFSKQ